MSSGSPLPVEVSEDSDSVDARFHFFSTNVVQLRVFQEDSSLFKEHKEVVQQFLDRLRVYCEPQVEQYGCTLHGSTPRVHDSWHIVAGSGMCSQWSQALHQDCLDCSQLPLTRNNAPATPPPPPATIFPPFLSLYVPPIPGDGTFERMLSEDQAQGLV